MIAEAETLPATTPCESSPDVDQLLPALHQVQGEIRPALKTAENPHYHKNYADLTEVWEAVKGPLRNHGFTVAYPMRPLAGGLIEVAVILWHESKQWVRSSLPLAAGKPQEVGSGITYYRRYLLSALLALPTADDDGEAASGRGLGTSQPQRNEGRRDSRPPQVTPSQDRQRPRQDRPESPRDDRRRVKEDFPSKQDLARAAGEIRQWAQDFALAANVWWRRFLGKKGMTVPAKFDRIIGHPNQVLFHLVKHAQSKGATLPEGFKFSTQSAIEFLAPIWLKKAEKVEAEAWRYVKQDCPRKIREEMDSAGASDRSRVDAYEEALAN